MKALSWPLVAILLTITLAGQAHLVNRRLIPVLENPDCPWCDTSASGDQVSFIPSHTILTRILAPADPYFLADLVWARMAYYFGSHALTDSAYPYLEFLLNKVTDLAPRWQYPYWAGAAMLYFEANSPVQALVLISKGMQTLPDLWILPFFKGYIFWKEFQDYQAASRFLLQASQLKNAPKYLAGLSVRLAQESGQQEFLDVFIQMMDKHVADPFQRELMRKRIEEK